jgi:acetylxylan esterase
MLFSILSSLLLGATGALAAAGSLQEVKNFGTNPTGVQMFVYKPARLANPPPLIVAIHYCSGTAPAYFSGTQWANRADTKGFIVVYPDAPDSGGCWDVHTTATLTHNGGGDSLGIISMVKYAIANYGVDASNVYVTGLSSGAMMTNVLLGAYPDVFKAGSALAGVPYGCFAGSGMWNNACANGQLIKTAAEWVSLLCQKPSCLSHQAF